MTAQRITSTTLDGFQYAVRIQRTAADISTTEMYIGQSFESANSIPFANKTVVLSFWARAGANFSSTSNILSVRLYTGTGTDQSGLGSSFTGTASPISANATLTTSWQRFQYTATLASTATQMQLLVFAGTTGTAGAADYYDVTGFQVELGAIATPFSRSQGTIQGELAACQRYYYRTGVGSATITTYGLGMAVSTTSAGIYIQYPVTMRVNPTSIDYADLAVSDLVNYTLVLTSLALSDRNNIGGKINAGVASGLTTLRPAFLVNNSNLTGYLGLSAEL
jgi:hypothetical protein